MKISPRKMGLTGVVFWVSLQMICSCSEQPGSLDTTSLHRHIIATFEPYPRGAGELELDRWYSVQVQDEPAGAMHLTISSHATPRGIRRVVVTQERVVVRRAEHRVEMLSRGMSLENDRGELLRYRQVEQQSGGDQRVVEAGRVGDQMITLRGPEVTRIKYKAKAIGSQMPYRFVFWDQPVRQKQLIDFLSYSCQTASYVNNHLEVLSVSGAENRVVRAHHTIDAMPGMYMRVDLDQEHVPLCMETALGALRLRFVSKEQEPRPVLGANVPDLDPLLRVKSNVVFKHRGSVAFARYRLTGLPKHLDESWLTGPGQRVVERPQPGVFVLEVDLLEEPAKADFPPEFTSEEKQRFKPYLASSALSPLDQPEVQGLAKQVTSKARDAWTAVRSLRNWVSRNIESHMGMVFASAVEVLRKKRGDCTEQSVLLTTLARAVGIPARCVMGLVYQNEMFARHMWTEVWVDGWRSIDAAMHTDSVTAAWIRLGEHSLQLTDDTKSGLGGMLAFVSDLKVSVEAHSTERRSASDRKKPVFNGKP